MQRSRQRNSIAAQRWTFDGRLRNDSATTPAADQSGEIRAISARDGQMLLLATMTKWPSLSTRPMSPVENQPWTMTSAVSLYCFKRVARGAGRGEGRRSGMFVVQRVL
jgi:hypothetical protein